MKSALRCGAATGLLLLPVFWAGPVQSMDLSSHTYNAWLAQMIRQGELPGLWIEPMLVNTLFDRLLDLLAASTSFAAAEQIAMSLTLLVFCGGMAIWVRAVAGRFPWELSPLLLLAAHGSITQAGFTNFLLSMGFAGMAGAALLAGGRIRWAALPAAPLAYLCNPFGAVMIISISGYLFLARRLTGWEQARLFAAAVAGLVALTLAVAWLWPNWQAFHFLAFSGVSTITPYRIAYFLPGFLYLLLAAALALAAASSAGRAVWTGSCAQVVALTGLACLLLPWGILLPGHATYFSYIGLRIGLVVMLATLAWLGSFHLPRRAAWLGSAGLAALYFGLLLFDHLSFRQFDIALREAVLSVPPRSRVILPHRANGYLLDPLDHALDRACLGHCYSYFNYEPSSFQFRIRAAAGNGVVESDRRRIERFEISHIDIRADDLPLYLVVYQEGRLEARPAGAGERVDRTAIVLPSPFGGKSRASGPGALH